MRLIIITTVFALSVAATAADQSVTPGLYQVVTTGAQPSTERHCVTAAEAGKSSLLPDMPAACRVSQNSIAGGKINLAYSCPSMSGSMVGSYTPTSYTADSKFRVVVAGKAIAGSNHVVAKRIGAVCTADD